MERGGRRCAAPLPPRGGGCVLLSNDVARTVAEEALRAERPTLDTLNGVFARHVETRKRNACYYVPAIVPVWPQVRLLEDDDAHGTYAEVYDAHCARYRREPDLPVTLFKAALDPAILGDVVDTEESSSSTDFTGDASNPVAAAAPL